MNDNLVALRMDKELRKMIDEFVQEQSGGPGNVSRSSAIRYLIIKGYEAIKKK